MTKKTLLFILLISNLQTLYASSKFVRAKVSSEVETETNLINKSTSIRYIPIKGKIYTTLSNGARVNYFFKVRGDRKNINEKNESGYLIEEKLPGLVLIDIPSTYKEIEKKDKEEIRNFSSKGSLHYHGPHEHDDADDHDHDHDEEEHSHEHDPNVLSNVVGPERFKFVNDGDDIQLKLGVEYLPSKYTKYRLTYMPTSYNGDELRYHNSVVASIDHTKLINDNTSITIKPKLTTYNGLMPYIGELRTDLRYKKDENTILSATVYNGLQLNTLNYIHNFKNALELTYDYNTEKRRMHEFWEVLDHEHEKIDQIKASLRIEQNGFYKLNPLKNKLTYYDLKGNIINTVFNAKLKKSDVFVKNLILEDEFEIDSTIKYMLNNARKYKIKSTKYLNENSDVKSDVLKDKEEILSINKDKSQYKKLTKKDGKYELEEGVSNNPDSYRKIVAKSELRLVNKFKAKYKKFMIKHNIGANFDLLNNRLNLNNEILAEYKAKIMGFNVKPIARVLTEAYFIDKQLNYFYHIPSIALDISKDIEIEDLKLKLGVKGELGAEIRKATEFGVYNPLEANKYVFGNFVSVRPYVEAKYSFPNNLILQAKLSVPTYRYKDAVKNYGYKMIPAGTIEKMKNIEAKINLKYEW